MPGAIPERADLLHVALAGGLRVDRRPPRQSRRAPQRHVLRGVHSRNSARGASELASETAGNWPLPHQAPIRRRRGPDVRRLWIPMKCNKRRQNLTAVFVLQTDGWHLTETTPARGKGGSGSMDVSGAFLVAPGYPGCCACSNTSFVRCGKVREHRVLTLRGHALLVPVVRGFRHDIGGRDRDPGGRRRVVSRIR